ncbi:MAG: hypothetical protein APF81_26365 [Desulfosporosinus sp. BRH_c37]|nr:MAG: hypothetical protein APF81_26365 [Desulfosporosinus sp. BRH_c37]
MISKVIGLVTRLLDAEKAGVMLFDKEKNELVLQKPAFTSQDDEVINAYRVPFGGEGNAMRVYTTGEPYISNDSVRDSRLLNKFVLMFPAKNTITVPLEVGNRRIGVLHVNDKRNGNFTLQDLEILTFLTSHLAIFIENAILYERENKQANVLNELNAKIIIHQKRLEKMMSIHNQLIEQVLNGEGMLSITKTLANLVESAIVVEDQQYHLVHSTEPIEENNYSVRNLLDQKQDLKSKLRNGQIVKIEPYVYQGEERAFIIAPIGSGRNLMGYLSLIKVLKENSKDLDKVAIKQGAMVLALELMKDKIKFEVESRYRVEFLDDLFSCTLCNAEQIIQRADFFNYDLKQPSRVVLININGSGNWEGTLNDEQDYSDLQKNLVTCSHKLLPTSFVVGKGNTLKLLVPCRGKSKQEELILKLNEIRDQITELHQGKKVAIGVGSECCGPENFQKSYKQAVKTLTIASILGKWNQVVFCEELGVYGLLFEINNSDLLREFVLEKLGPLLEYDQKRNSSLVETLRQYLKTNGSLKDAAEALAIHVGTLKYRIGRIQEILKIDLKQTENHFDLQLAISACRIVKSDL